MAVSALEGTSWRETTKLAEDMNLEAKLYQYPAEICHSAANFRASQRQGLCDGDRCGLVFCSNSGEIADPRGE